MISTTEQVKATTNRSDSSIYLENAFQFAKQASDDIVKHSCPNIIDGSVLCSGFQRQADEQIFQRILSLIEKRDPSLGPIRVLEVGAGVSLPFIEDEGAPWLSRMMKHQLGDKISITVSDAQTTDFQQLLSMEINGKKLGSCLVAPYIDTLLEPYVSALPSFSQDVLTPGRNYRVTELRNIIDSLSYDRITNLLKAQSVDIDDSALSISMAPCIRPELERQLFGIEYCPGVDLLNLGSAFKEDSFDFIFGRHLYPVLEEDLDRLSNLNESVYSVLRMDGEAYLYFDISPGVVTLSKNSNHEVSLSKAYFSKV